MKKKYDNGNVKINLRQIKSGKKVTMDSIESQMILQHRRVFIMGINSLHITSLTYALFSHKLGISET
jgi:hypothetical protein